MCTKQEILKEDLDLHHILKEIPLILSSQKNISKKSRKSILVKSTMNIEYVTYYITLP